MHVRSQRPVAKGWRVTRPTLWAGVLSLTLLALLALGFPGIARAEAQKATLTIVLTYTHDDVTYPIEGITAEAYQVATLDDELQHYELTEPFSSLQVDFNEDIPSGAMYFYAKQAAIMAEKDGMKGVSRTSDTDGELRFGELNYGIYLVRETGATEAADAFQDFEPFLISVPQIDEGEVTYEVISWPKLPLKSSGSEGWIDPNKPTPDPDNPTPDPDEPTPDPDNPTPDPDKPTPNPTTPTTPTSRVTTRGQEVVYPWPTSEMPVVYPGWPYTGYIDPYRRLSPDTKSVIEDIVTSPSPSQPTNTTTTHPTPSPTQGSVAQPAAPAANPVSGATNATVPQTTVVSTPAAATGETSRMPLSQTGDETSWTAFMALAAGGIALVACAVVAKLRRGSRTRVDE